MSSQTNPPAQSDDDQKKPGKGRVIQPLHEDQLKAQMDKDAKLAQANADVLTELAKKTAALAEQYSGNDLPKAKHVNLDNQSDISGAEPVDLFAALEQSDDTEKELKVELNNPETDSSPAVELIRSKLNKIYGKEPDATTEAAEAVAAGNKRSKHQQFMYDLTASGDSLADIQTKWHNYYIGLPNDEKHEVWQEFYRNQNTARLYQQEQSRRKKRKQPKMKQVSDATVRLPKRNKHVSLMTFNSTGNAKAATNQAIDIKSNVLEKVSANGKLRPVDHAKSLLFGLGLAAIVGGLFGFIFFNEVFIAPFVSPSRSVSATPIIGQVDQPVGPEPKIVIPKINVDVPVVYDVGTVAEDAIQEALEDGVVHYAASPEPGQKGNSVIVGHSSNNILNGGRYKFAFVLLRRLEIDDVFYVHKDGIRYTYKIYDSKVVPPTDTTVLGDAAKPNSITLITCDPPGTSINRLIIVGEQISPDPATNEEASIDVLPEETEALPSNAPSLWSRLNPFD